jgi:ribosomal protein L35
MKTKHKTHKATAKRFKLTKNGKLMHNSQGDNAHLKVNKSYHQKARQNGKGALKNPTETKTLTKLLNK